MKVRCPNYNTAFHCLGGSCPDTCCRDWSVVPDEDALADYAAAPSPLRERIAQNLDTDDDGDVCFRLDEQGMCALLTPDGLCAIQRDWGEAHLCAHCAAYPRFTEEYGCLTETALAVSCPEAARLLREQPRFVLLETDDGAAGAPFDGVDADLLAGLESSRAAVLALLNEEAIPLWERLQIMLAFAAELQEHIDCGAYQRLAACSMPNLTQTQTLPAERQALAIRLLDALSQLEPLRPDWPALLRQRRAQLSALSQPDYAALCAGYAQKRPRWERGLANFACYLVFRHWHKTVNDDALYGRAAFLCAACLTVYHLALFQPENEDALWSRFSREVEHLDENLDELIWSLPELFNETPD